MSTPQLPDFQGGRDRPPAGGPPAPELPPGRRGGGARAAVILSIVGGAIVVALVAALVLWHTVLRPDPLDPTGAGSDPISEPPSGENSEFIPEGEPSEPEEAPVETMTAPTTPCRFFDQPSTTPQVAGELRSADLAVTLPSGWTSEVNWEGTFSYAVDAAHGERHIEDRYYAIATVATVLWPEDEVSTEPGPVELDEAARAAVQCHLTRDDGISVYGEEPELDDYVDEETTVDGHPAWIVRGTVSLQHPGEITTYSSVDVAAVAVDTPEGPTIFRGAAPADNEMFSGDVEEMLETLTVL